MSHNAKGDWSNHFCGVRAADVLGFPFRIVGPSLTGETDESLLPKVGRVLPQQSIDIWQALSGQKILPCMQQKIKVRTSYDP